MGFVKPTTLFLTVWPKPNNDGQTDRVREIKGRTHTHTNTHTLLLTCIQLLYFTLDHTFEAERKPQRCTAEAEAKCHAHMDDRKRARASSHSGGSSSWRPCVATRRRMASVKRAFIVGLVMDAVQQLKSYTVLLHSNVPLCSSLFGCLGK